MKNLTILFPVFFSCLSLQAQESVNAGGGDIAESGITIAYSIGQVFSEPVIYTEGSLTPGIQQAYEITLVSTLPEMNLDLQIRAYPNPADDYLLLSFPEYRKAVHTLRLIDSSGKNIYMDEVKEELSRLEVQGLTQGVYFLQIANKEQIIQLFKIIKK
ncbi:MAG: T9SS type A sorting domain-containing protein [Dysgonamonadaceae bacterium]|nr:T9SS type A sorting domain-containing protein [Dysgonamonadaceae bacterium]